MSENLDAYLARRSDWQSKYFRNLETISQEPSPAYETDYFYMILKQVKQLSTSKVGWMGYVYNKDEEFRDATELCGDRESALNEGKQLTDGWQSVLERK